MSPRRTSRRRFLTRATRAGLGIGLGGGLLSGCPSEGEAVGPVATGGAGPEPWGAAPAGALEGLLPAAARPEGVLELFLTGGVNPWDSFYVVPEFGDPAAGGPRAGSMWWTYQEPYGEEPTVPEMFAACGGGAQELLQPFAADSAGRTVHLGPFVLALRERPDLLARMRVVVMRHSQAPHETAIPLSLCGHRFGSPRMASTGTHVQRFHQERSPRVPPHAYVLYPGLFDLDAFSADVGTALGLHPGVARPLELSLRFMDRLATQLGRTQVPGDLARYDRAVDHYTAIQRRRLTTPGRDGTVRAPAFEDFEFARRSMAGSPELTDLFPEALLGTRPGEACGYDNDLDDTEHGLAVATRLLTHPTTPARWVTSIDGGLEGASGGLAYDTHNRHVAEGGRNLTHAMRRLVRRINEPGEGDPDKLDLDRHLVVVSTEFGRTPYKEGEDGLDHWPGGYVQVLLGGPIGPDQAGVVGAIGEDGVATDWVTPAEFRAGMLQAQGIWPFSPEAFAVGELRGGETGLDAAMALRERLWGRPT